MNRSALTIYCPPSSAERLKGTSSRRRAHPCHPILHVLHGGHDPLPADPAASGYAVANVVMALDRYRTDSDLEEYYQAGYKKFEIPTSERVARKELRNFSVDVQLRQHRTFVFGVLVTSTHAEIIRYDRTGTASCQVDLKTDAHVFFGFVACLGHASSLHLGFDPSAVKVDEDTPEASRLQQALEVFPPHTRLRSYVRKAFAKTHWPLYQVSVPDKNGSDRQHEFLVRNVTTSAVHSTGDAVRGYIAFHIRTGVFHYLKDCWRAVCDDQPPKELRVYEELAPLHISGVASVRCGGDLPGQLTRTQQFPEAGDYLPRAHTRIVFNEIGNR